MAREIKGILYETVVCNDALLHRLRASPDEFEDFQELRYVKYVVLFLLRLFRLTASGRFVVIDKLAYASANLLEDIRFLKVRAFIIQELNPSVKFAHDAVCPLFTIELCIISDVSLATISSILRSKLHWGFLDREPSDGPVLGITTVLCSSRATLSVGEPDCSGLFTPISSGIRAVQVLGRSRLGITDPQKLEISIRTLLRLLPTTLSLENTMPDQHELQILCGNPEVVKVWLQEVSRTETRSNDANLQFSSCHLGFSETLALISVLLYSSMLSSPVKNFCSTSMGSPMYTEGRGHTEPMYQCSARKVWTKCNSVVQPLLRCSAIRLAPAPICSSSLYSSISRDLMASMS